MMSPVLQMLVIKNFLNGLKYTKTNAREDFAESAVCWIAVRHKSNKNKKSEVIKINKFIPNRLKFFDEMNFNMYPM